MADPRLAAATRRAFLLRLAGTAAGFAMLPATAHATPEAMQEAIGRIAGERELQRGRVTLEVPPLVENGNVVPLTIAVDSPMTEADHVKSIHIVNEKNPQPQVISVTLGPRAGRAALSTRIKLADSQHVVAIAEMSDGTLWLASAEIIVTLAACVEDLVR